MLIMDEEAYKRELYRYDAQISEIEQKIAYIKREISETEAAKENLKKLMNDFNVFVSGNLQKNRKQTTTHMLKCFRSLIKKTTGLLTGKEHNMASDKIDKMKEMINSKLNNLYSELDYCNSDLAVMKKRRKTCYSDYLAKLNANEEVK